MACSLVLRDLFWHCRNKVNSMETDGDGKDNKKRPLRTNSRVRTVVAGLCKGNREVCIWCICSYGKLLVASGRLHHLTVQLNYQILPQGEDTLDSPPPKMLDSGCGSELCLQITSLRFVWNDLTDEGLL